MREFAALLRRDLALALAEGSALGTALGFYLIVVTLMPLGLGPDLKLLSRIAPGVLWIALLLAALLSLPRLFEADLEDGSLEVMATGSLRSSSPRRPRRSPIGSRREFRSRCWPPCSAFCSIWTLPSIRLFSPQCSPGRRP